MTISPMSAAVQHLRRAVLRDGAGMTDGELLEFFVRQHDDAALAALVRRHGPMVWGVCRRLLRSHHDAEDAFQATFLILVRKAATIQRTELVGNWLYGVARQTAVKARAMAAKRCVRERQAAPMPEPAAAEERPADERKSLLDEELSRLPEKYRVLIVLCDLEGNTRKEVARQLGCPEGTVAGRLVRAREMLAKRLARQGVALAGVALGTVLSAQGASAAVPATLTNSTIKAATLLAAGKAAPAGVISANVAALTQGVIKAMFVTKLKIAGLLLGVVFGAGVLVTAEIGGSPLAVPIAAPDRADQPAAKREPKAGDVEAMLKAKNFWAKIGKKSDHPDLAANGPAIKKLAEESKDAAVRIRAFKLSADLEGKTKRESTYLPAEVEDAVEGAFTHLEANAKDATIQKFRPQIGFTHITVSKRAGDADGVWVLIETTNKETAGGLNMRWNPSKKSVDKVEHWGADRSQ